MPIQVTVAVSRIMGYGEMDDGQHEETVALG